MNLKAIRRFQKLKLKFGTLTDVKNTAKCLKSSIVLKFDVAICKF